MIYHDMLFTLNTSRAAGAFEAVQERGGLTQELVILVILVVIALALILVCGLMGRREEEKWDQFPVDKLEAEIPSPATKATAPIMPTAETMAIAGKTGKQIAVKDFEAEGVKAAFEPTALAAEVDRFVTEGKQAEPIAEVDRFIIEEDQAEPRAEVDRFVIEEDQAEPQAEVDRFTFEEEQAEPRAEMDRFTFEEERAEPRAEMDRFAVEETEPAPAPPRPDDLKVVEGIGPKVSRLLNEAGIFTFAQLAEADPIHLKRILEAAKLQMMNLESWPEQARLAGNGDWDALKKMQDELKGGRH